MCSLFTFFGFLLLPPQGRHLPDEVGSPKSRMQPDKGKGSPFGGAVERSETEGASPHPTASDRVQHGPSGTQAPTRRTPPPRKGSPLGGAVERSETEGGTTARKSTADRGRDMVCSALNSGRRKAWLQPSAPFRLTAFGTSPCGGGFGPQSLKTARDASIIY